MEVRRISARPVFIQVEPSGAACSNCEIQCETHEWQLYLLTAKGQKVPMKKFLCSTCVDQLPPHQKCV